MLHQSRASVLTSVLRFEAEPHPARVGEMVPNQGNEHVKELKGQKVAQGSDHGLGQVGQVVADVRYQVGKDLEVRSDRIRSKS